MSHQPRAVALASPLSMGMCAATACRSPPMQADKRAADAEQYTGLLARCQELEGEVLQAQAELTEVQAASLAKDTRIRELETR